MELHFGRAKELGRKRSIPGWLLVGSAFLGYLWQALQGWQTLEWLVPKVFPRGLPRMLQPTPLAIETAVLFVSALIWFAAIIIGANRNLRNRAQALANELLEFLKTMGDAPLPKVDATMAEEDILAAGGDELSDWVKKVRGQYASRFESRVNAIIDELAEADQRDGELHSTAHKQSHRAKDIRMIAERLLVLSSRL